MKAAGTYLHGYKIQTKHYSEIMVGRDLLPVVGEGSVGLLRATALAQ